ncbi:MAG: Ig-like domain-containing protein, partial [Cyclobacteriaceae bacterium]
MKRSLKIFILSCWLLTPALSCLGQLVDDFADNNFTADPLWTGVESNFVIDNFQLRLQAPVVNGTAYLSTESHSINNAMWEFTLKLDFNPSGTNYARIYLVSSNGDLSGSLNGYFVLVGDTPDEISLYRQSGAATSKIIDGADGSVNISVVNAAIRVTRDDLGNWELFSDVGLSGAFVSQGSVFDNTFNSSDYFGVYCNYTSTRSDKFYFDNFVVTGGPYIDLDPPVVEQIEVTSSNSVIVHFDELLNIASSTQLDNYIVNNDIGHPNLATLLSDAKSVELAFDQTFKNGFTHNLEISDVTDLAGNLISQISQSFLYFFQLP